MGGLRRTGSCCLFRLLLGALAGRDSGLWRQLGLGGFDWGYLNLAIFTDLICDVLFGDKDHGCATWQIQADRIFPVVPSASFGHVALLVA